MEIFDLGFFANEFKLQTTIQMYALIRAIDIHCGREFNNKISLDERAEELRIVDIQPIQYSES